MVSGSSLNCNRLFFSAPFQPSLSPSEAPHCQIPFFPLSHFHLAGSPLPLYSQLLQPKLSGSNGDTWRIYSQSRKDSTLNLQRERYELQPLQSSSCCFETISFGERWFVIYNHLSWRMPFFTHFSSLLSRLIIRAENQRKPWVVVIWHVQTKKKKKKCHLQVAFINILIKTITSASALIAW